MEAKGIEFEKLEEIAKESGLSQVAYLDAGTIELLDEVRGMCAANTCGMYGKNKACPPSCGTLDECREKVSKFRWGMVVQTVGDLDDPFDYEGMMETEAQHKKHFFTLIEKLKSDYPDMLPLGSGCCTVCKTCAGPDAPCRFPEKRISSLEAYGIVVSDLCSKNGLKYNYGSDHIAYTSCCLLG